MHRGGLEEMMGRTQAGGWKGMLERCTRETREQRTGQKAILKA
jgi:hypothetical protein